MHITLDEEQWQLPDETSVMEVLAAISDKARAQHRIVTSLTIGGKAINDRDLIPAFLNQPVKGLGDARAASKSFHCIITEAKQAIGCFAAQVMYAAVHVAVVGVVVEVNCVNYALRLL